MISDHTAGDSFRDKVATVDKEGRRIRIFPKRPKGRLYNIRSWVSLAYIILFFALPFIYVNGHPLFLVNIPERRFILFGQIFWPQDFFIFGLGMILFVVFIALFTVVFGRIFCGWICPQTVFMEMIFRKIEYFTDGDAAAQKILKKAPWNTDKIIRRIAKWVSFWAISFIIANTFLAYIIGITSLRKIVSEPVSMHLGGLTALIIFTAVFFFIYSWMREQICTVICPYGRLQGVLLDRNSIIVAYDHKRGEPRGKFRKNEIRTSGDCIDCLQCVQVCPTGIDIRNGTQLECINCTACIDACNKMMDAINQPKGLIRYASESNISDGKKTRFTARMKAYSVVMCLLLCMEIYLLASRTDAGITILRTPGQLYQQQPDHQLSNLYNYKLLNKTYDEMHLTLRPEDFKGTIRLVGEKDLHIPKEGALSGSLFVLMDSAEIQHTETAISIGVYKDGKKIKTIRTSFLGPFTGD